MKKGLLFFFTIVMLVASCTSSKDFVYVNDMVPHVPYPIKQDYEAVVQRGDRLKITVSCKIPELAIPFNMNGDALQVDLSGKVIQSDSRSMTERGGYRVDNNGNILFPVLGVLNVAGLKVSEVTDLIRNKIIEGKYIKEPLVTLDFLNFKYTVLGAVGSNGTYSGTGDRINLLEAIAAAGNVTPEARLDRICVIREEGFSRTMYYHDIRKKDIFDSPCFYLQQNDIVYVEPKSKMKQKSEDKFFKYITLLFSIISATTNIIWISR